MGAGASAQSRLRRANHQAVAARPAQRHLRTGPHAEAEAILDAAVEVAYDVTRPRLWRERFTKDGRGAREEAAEKARLEAVAKAKAEAEALEVKRREDAERKAQEAKRKEGTISPRTGRARRPRSARKRYAGEKEAAEQRAKEAEERRLTEREEGRGTRGRETERREAGRRRVGVLNHSPARRDKCDDLSGRRKRGNVGSSVCLLPGALWPSVRGDWRCFGPASPSTRQVSALRVALRFAARPWLPSGDVRARGSCLTRSSRTRLGTGY